MSSNFLEQNISATQEGQAPIQDKGEGREHDNHMQSGDAPPDQSRIARREGAETADHPPK